MIINVTLMVGIDPILHPDRVLIRPHDAVTPTKMQGPPLCISYSFGVVNGLSLSGLSARYRSLGSSQCTNNMFT